MARQFKPFVVSAMLVLYAGMMLAGQSLHWLTGCEHDHGLPQACLLCGHSPAVVAGEQHLHDADDCPICQFQSHGQLAPSLPVSELRQFLVARLPLHASPVFAVCVSRIYSPRGPPCV